MKSDKKQSIIKINIPLLIILAQAIILNLLICQSVSGQTNNELLNKQISLEETQYTVQEILNVLTQDYQINLSYDPKSIPLERKLNLNETNPTLETLLDQVCRGIGVKYSLYDDLVILTKLKSYTLSGFIEDGETGERLIGATIYNLNLNLGTISNNYGFFSISLSEGISRIYVSYVGYESYSYEINIQSDTSLIIKLKPGILLDEARITATYHDKMNSSDISVEKLSVKRLNELPTLVGEVDIMKSMQFLPGVQFGTEASSGLIVRGGSPEQNLILLDGAPVYNSNHTFGLFSVFNSDALKNVTMMKGGFPARYGGRLSSVIDIRMKEGNMNEYHGCLNLGFIASKFTLEGPIVKDKASFMISGRRTFLDLLLDYESQFDIPNTYFYDLNSKLNYKISDKNRLYFSSYIGSDTFVDQDSFEDRDYYDKDYNTASWGNKTFLLRWNHIFNNKLFSNLSVIYSEYALNLYLSEKRKDFAIYTDEFIEYESGIDDFSVKYNFDYYPTNSHAVKFGLDYIYHTFYPGSLEDKYENFTIVNGEKVYSPFGLIHTESSNDELYTNEFRAFVEDDIKISSRIKTNLGIHYSGFYVQNTYYQSIEPRFAINFQLHDNFAIKGAYSRMKQYLHLMTHTSAGLPTDLWLPVTSKIKPQYSDQYTLGFHYDLNKDYEFGIETYYKHLGNVYTYSDGADYLTANNTWENNVVLGKGISYGVECVIHKNTGKLSGWLSYTYSNTDREFENINDGEPFPYKYDRTHQVSTVLKYSINKELSYNLTWLYATGMAYTLAKDKYSSIFNLYSWNSRYYEEGYINNYEGRNNERMPAYHRLDMSLQYVKPRKKVTNTWSIGVYNAYARFNPYVSYWDSDEQGQTQLKQIALFSIIPSISYRVEF